MESTLLDSFLKASKLKHWLAQTDCPQVFQEIRELFERVYAPKTHNSNEDMRDNSKVSTPMRNAPVNLKCLLGHNCEKVSMQARLRCNGVLYSVNSTHAGNGQIYFIPMEIPLLSQSLHPFDTFSTPLMVHILQFIMRKLYLIISLIHLLATHTSQRSSTAPISKPLLRKLTQPGSTVTMHNGLWMTTTWSS